MTTTLDSRTAAPRGRDRRLRGAIRALVRRFQISERADVSCCGMTVAQAAMLEVLDLEGPLRLGDLSRRLGISPSTLSRNFTRLAERGWVDRQPDPGDGRVTMALLTSAGRAAAARVERQEIRFAGEILDRLPADARAGVVAALESLLGAIREASEHCCPGAFDHLMRESPRDARGQGDEG